MSKVSVFGLVLPAGVARSSGSLAAPDTQPQGTQPHTFLSSVVPVSFHLPLPEGGREGSVHNAPKQKNKNSTESPPQMLARPSACQLSLLNTVKTGKLHKATKRLWASSGQSRLNLSPSTSLWGQLLCNF